MHITHWAESTSNCNRKFYHTP